MHVRGTCHVYIAVDLGFAIDLPGAERTLGHGALVHTFKQPRRAPEAAQLQRRSFRVSQSGFPLEVGAWRTEGPVEVALWEFGSASFDYAIPVDGELAALVGLADALWDHPALLADARRRADQLVAHLGAAIDKPNVGARLEDYVVFELHLDPGAAVSALWTDHAATCAQILRCEPGALSDQEIADALSRRCAYVPDEVMIIDWFAAILCGDHVDDERVVLELAVAELLQLKNLDDKLDRGIDAAYAMLRRPRSWLGRLRVRADDQRRIAELQADAAVLFEGADNALKLLGDQYLARLYRVVSERFHLPQWDTAIERKLEVLDGIHEKVAAGATHRRAEFLEVIIILLFVLEIALAVFK